MRALPTALLLPLLLVACGDGDETAAPSEPPVETGLPPADSGAADGSGDSQLADVAVSIDGDRIGLEGACQGADGAVVATATTGRQIILVREEGPAIRLSTEGDTFTETTDVTTNQIGVSEIYEGSVPVEGQPTPVSIEVRTDVELAPCEAVQQ